VKIADEVMTGFGRTGNLFASEYCEVKPDIICLSKGITGGTMPLGATTCNEKVASVFETSDNSKTFYHGHSFTANPLACACANASLDLLLTEECQGKIKEISNAHKQFAEEIKSHSAVLKVTTLGTIFSMELKSDEKSGYLNSLRDKISKYFLSKDILLRPLGNVIYVLPPYVIEKEDLDKIYGEIKMFLNNLNK
ncbi:MAG TPA: aminotransferase class III-fold pyridoxal phosphate-dependent enzyme, partial [Cytophagaceae bacterium]